MPRTKQSVKGRSKPHQKRVLALRKRKNKKKGARRKALGRPRRRQPAKKK